jgi:hypothetical protein
LFFKRDFLTGLEVDAEQKQKPEDGPPDPAGGAFANRYALHSSGAWHAHARV